MLRRGRFMQVAAPSDFNCLAPFLPPVFCILKVCVASLHTLEVRSVGPDSILAAAVEWLEVVSNLIVSPLLFCAC
jgi:hypothetical protein